MKKPVLRFMLLTLALTTLALALCFTACGGSSSSDAYVFKANGTEIAIGAPAKATIGALGDWVSMNSSESCGGISGKDYIYSYNGFRVYTTPAQNGDIVCKIELTDDSVSTPEGVRVGMTESEAKTAMKGKGTADTGNGNLVYTADGMKLQIICRDGYVTGVIYVAA